MTFTGVDIDEIIEDLRGRQGLAYELITRILEDLKDNDLSAEVFAYLNEERYDDDHGAVL